MLGINSSSGVFDSIGLIDSIIVDLDTVEVKGVNNMRIIFNTIGKLDALKKAIIEQKEGENA